MRREVFIDIETIPSQRLGVKERLAEKVTPPGRMSKPETIAKWEREDKPEEVENVWQKTALDGTLGEVVVIGWAIDDGPPEVRWRDLDGDESAVIFDALSTIRKQVDDGPGQYRSPCWIGHYITGFDLRFLWQRCVILGLLPPIRIPHDAKPWSDEVFDTKMAWAGQGRNGISSMDDLCFAMGLDCKGDIDGSKVWDYVREGRIEEVAEYCKQDVERTRTLYRRMTFNPEVMP